MTELSGGVTRRLLEKLLDDQRRRSERERKMPYSKKLEVVDRLMRQGRRHGLQQSGKPRQA
jgi:hypothetical protein